MSWFPGFAIHGGGSPSGECLPMVDAPLSSNLPLRDAVFNFDWLSGPISGEHLDRST